ncbi:MAG: zinc-dependent metalloprotease [Pirellulaceae bacterium]|nr:zinc-dependent metalloprotease [Pirellulaceae bacterium]
MRISPARIIVVMMFYAICAFTNPIRGESEEATATAKPNDTTTADAGKSSDSPQAPQAATPPKPEHVAILKDAEAIEGLIPLHHRENKLFAELSSSQYGKEYIVLISIARGIGEGFLVGGMSWNDDWVWAFRKVDKRVLIVRKNVRFRAKDGSPEAAAVKHSHTDSVLYSLPILSKGPKGGDLIDLTPVFMSDLPQISHMLPGFSFSASKSTWSTPKGFPRNVELEVAATYSSSGRARIDSVADTRGVTINVHYSISEVPKTGYQSRLADDRVGYFLTVIRDYSSKGEPEQFTRYINRWNIKKADSKLDLSPPEQPVVFYIENTVPYKYRKTIRDGILEWNKAFEKAGFVDALEVRQQPEERNIEEKVEPEDVRYNFIRWMTADAPFSGIGPSRVNPYTGQILDADILLNSNMVEHYEYLFETIGPQDEDDGEGGAERLFRFGMTLSENQMPLPLHLRHSQCQRVHALSSELTFGRAVIASKAAGEERAKHIEALIHQGLKATVMHEIGHTLGLRHNFKASSFRTLDELNKKDNESMIASVMDYDPANIVPQGMEQGNYFTPTIGPYDYWAIEYGYKPLAGGTQGEAAELRKITSRSGEPGLAYATDEDTGIGIHGAQIDPEAGVMDLGKNPLDYAKMRIELINEVMPKLIDRMTEDGDSYASSRRAFNSLLYHHNVALFHVARYVGGIRISRSHKGDENAPQPLDIVEPEKQREALTMLEKEVFGSEAYQFPPEIYGMMLSSRWNHWGSIRTLRPDYPLHDGISYWQSNVLNRLLSSDVLSRMHDNEAKLPTDQDAFTSAELIERLTHSIFSEVENLEPGEYTNRKPAITSLRRNLQRLYLKRLANIAMGRMFAPQDCQTVAYAELLALAERMEKLLNSNITLDSYSRAHLLESSSRIGKVADARLNLFSP